MPLYNTTAYNMAEYIVHFLLTFNIISLYSLSQNVNNNYINTKT
jgi:hypothetical protein